MKAASEIHEWEFGWLGKHTGKSSTKGDYTCRVPCPCSSILRRGVRAVLARRGSTFGTRVDSAGWCAGVRRGGRAVGVPEDDRVSRGSRGDPQGLLADASACAARKQLTKPQTKDFGFQSRCLRRCGLSSSSLAAAGPGPLWRQGALPAPGSRRGFTQLSGSPRRAGMLPQEDELSIEKPRRRHTPAIGQRGRRAGARAAGAGAAAPGSSPRQQLPVLEGRRREPGASPALGGARRRGRVAPGRRTVPRPTCGGLPAAEPAAGGLRGEGAGSEEV